MFAHLSSASPDDDLERGADQRDTDTFSLSDEDYTQSRPLSASSAGSAEEQDDAQAEAKALLLHYVTDEELPKPGFAREDWAHSLNYCTAVAALVALLGLVAILQSLTLKLDDSDTDVIKRYWGFDLSPQHTTEVPWLVSVRNSKDEHSCAGALVGPNLVLTVASCVVGRFGELQRANALRARIGSAPPGDRATAADAVPVAGIDVHPGYRAMTHDNDVAILRLARPSAVAPVALDRSLTDVSQVFADRAYWTARGVEVEATSLKPYSQCQSELSARGSLADLLLAGGMVCCSDLQWHSREMNDRGIPVFASSGRGHVLIALWSWAHGAESRRTHEIYTRVASYRCWLGRRYGSLSSTSHLGLCEGKDDGPLEGEEHVPFNLIDLWRGRR